MVDQIKPSIVEVAIAVLVVVVCLWTMSKLLLAWKQDELVTSSMVAERLAHEDARVRREAAYRAFEYARAPRLYRPVMDQLIENLDDEDLYLRRLAIKVLQKAGGRALGYRPDAPRSERLQAQQHWRLWWEAYRRAGP